MRPAAAARHGGDDDDVPAAVASAPPPSSEESSVLGQGSGGDSSSRDDGGGGEGTARSPTSERQRLKKKQSKHTGSAQRKHQSTASSSSSSKIKKPLGESAGIALLLSNHSLFGLPERVCYHFDLIETLRRSGEDNDDTDDKGGDSGAAASGSGGSGGVRSVAVANPRNSALETSAGNNFCGVSSLLECVPQIPPNKQTKKLRRLLRNRVKEFNLEARLFRSAGSSASVTSSPRCYQPPSLPLRPKPTTRVTFAYEMTSLVLCLDASSTITSTFGNLGTAASRSSSDDGEDGAICALDRLGGMVRRYLTALVEPVPGAVATNTTKTDETGDSATSSAGSNTPASWWMPELRVTVLAVFPKASSYVSVGSVLPLLENDENESGSELGRTSLLVRDYRVTDLHSAEELASAVEEWALSKVEAIIASRLSQAGGRTNDRIDAMSSSSLRDLLEICDDALASTLPPEGRPAVALATDCRSVDCQSVLEILGNTRRTDVPVHVLDLSLRHSQSSLAQASRGGRIDAANQSKAANEIPATQHLAGNKFQTFDDNGPETFPLGMSDDAEALYDLCRATGGCFLDRALLEEASSTTAGQVPSDSVLHGDHYLAFRRRALRPNAIQW